jgi:hypothetical protein
MTPDKPVRRRPKDPGGRTGYSGLGDQEHHGAGGYDVVATSTESAQERSERLRREKNLAKMVEGEVGSAPVGPEIHPVEMVEVRYTAVIEEIRLGSGGRPLFHALLDTIGVHAANGVYEVPNRDGRNITVTVEGL